MRIFAYQNIFLKEISRLPTLVPLRPDVAILRKSKSECRSTAFWIGTCCDVIYSETCDTSKEP